LLRRARRALGRFGAKRFPRRAGESLSFPAVFASLLIQQVVKVIDAGCSSQCRFSLEVTGRSPEQVPEIERRRRILWIAFYQKAVEALVFDNVSVRIGRSFPDVCLGTVRIRDIKFSKFQVRSHCRSLEHER
jgi:hypothetical protein